MFKSSSLNPVTRPDPTQNPNPAGKPWKAAARFSPLTSLCRPKPGANAHAPQRVTGPHVGFSWKPFTTTRSPEKPFSPATTSLLRPRRRPWHIPWKSKPSTGSGERKILCWTPAQRSGGVSTAPPTRRRSGGRVQWALRRCATLAAWGTNRGVWCRSTGRRRVRRSSWRSIRILIGKLWSSDDRRRWRRPTMSSYITITVRRLPWFSTSRRTVMITWSTTTLAQISDSLSDRSLVLFFYFQ